MLYRHSNLNQCEKVFVELVGLDKWEFDPTPNEGTSPKRVHSSRSFARSLVQCGEILLGELDKFKELLNNKISTSVTQTDKTRVTHPKTPGFIHSQITGTLQGSITNCLLLI
jgi:hypothetical protein